MGKIVAPNYKPKYFREYIGYHRQFTDGFRDDLTSRIVINAYLEPVARQVREQPTQQQQQQQTVIIPGAGTSEITARGMVMVSSTPENTDVYVDGAFVGNSPANLKLSEGIHIVEVKKLGFRPYKKELRVIGSSELNLRIILEKE